jgi:hypothetical protein
MSLIVNIIIKIKRRRKSGITKKQLNCLKNITKVIC